MIDTLREIVKDLRQHKVQGLPSITKPVSEAMNYIADRIEAALATAPAPVQGALESAFRAGYNAGVWANEGQGVEEEFRQFVAAQPVAPQPQAAASDGAVRRKCEVCQSLGHTTLEHGASRGYSHSVIPASEWPLLDQLCPIAPATLLNEFIGYISVEYGWEQERWENCQALARKFLDATQRADASVQADARPSCKNCGLRIYLDGATWRHHGSNYIECFCHAEPAVQAGGAGQPTCSHGVYAGAHCDKCEAYANELEEAETKKRAAGAAETPAGQSQQCAICGAPDSRSHQHNIHERLELLLSRLREAKKEPPMGWQAHIIERLESVLRNYPLDRRAAQPSADAERLRGALRDDLALFFDKLEYGIEVGIEQGHDERDMKTWNEAMRFAAKTVRQFQVRPKTPQDLEITKLCSDYAEGKIEPSEFIGKVSVLQNQIDAAAALRERHVGLATETQKKPGQTI